MCSCMCVCVYMHVCACVCVCVCTCMHMHACACVAWVCVCVIVCVHVCACMCMNVHVCVCVCVHTKFIACMQVSPTYLVEFSNKLSNFRLRQLPGEPRESKECNSLNVEMFYSMQDSYWGREGCCSLQWYKLISQIALQEEPNVAETSTEAVFWYKSLKDTLSSYQTATKTYH